MPADILYTIIIYPIVQIIECVFVFAQKMFKQTGLSVICVSAAVSLLCLPLYVVAERWQEAERHIQKNLAGKIAKIKAVFKGDERFMILQTYYRQNHYHPIYALRSAFGLLIQTPFFIAAYSYLSHLETLKGASFLFIGDLGAPDALIAAAGGINLLPILMTLINIFAGAIYTRTLGLKDRVQAYGMALLFLILLYNSPSGLVLYWTLNNVFSLIKNIYMKINIRRKHLIIFIISSSLCAVLILYTVFILRRDARIKSIMTLLFLCLGLIPWLTPVIKKIPEIIQRAFLLPKERLFVFLFSCLALCVLAGVFLPVMLISSSPQEFSYIDSYSTPLFFVGNTALQAFGFFVFWPLCLYFLFSREVKNVFAALSIVFFTAALCNVFLFAGNYGLVSIDLVFDSGVSHNFREMLINAGAVLAVCVFTLFILIKAGFKITLPLIVVPLAALVGISVLNMGHIHGEYQKLTAFHVPKKDITVIEPAFHLSKSGKNLIVIMLDRATSAFFPFILEESPDLSTIYDGFTYYPNTVSFSGYTRLGAPPIFGGYEYTPAGLNRRADVSIREKHNEALLLLPRIFSEAGYDVTVTDPPYPNYSYSEDLRIYDPYPGVKARITDGAYTDYWLKEHNISLPSNSDVLKRNILWYSILKIMPVAVREGIYQHGGWFAPFSGHKFLTNLKAYAVLDYLPELTGFTDENENSFLSLVNNTTHEALYYQAPEYRPSLNITSFAKTPYANENEYHTNIGSLKRLGEWFTYLKSKNVYDNTRIIIVSDHGAQINYVAKTGLPFNRDNVNPLLLVKDFNASFPLKTDMSFMSNADVPTLALTGLIENARNPWTGNFITSEEKKSPLYIAISAGIHMGDPNETRLTFDDKLNYYISGNIFDETNWVQAGK